MINPAIGGFIGLAGKCMDVKYADVNPGAVVGIATCNDTSAQRFVLTSDHEIRAMTAPELCLDAGPSRTSILTQTCNGTLTQKWDYLDGHLQLTFFAGCVAVEGGATTDGTPLELAACDTSPTQTFWPFGYPLTIKGRDGQRCADVLYANVAAGTMLDDAVCNQTRAQVFRFTEEKQISIGGYCVDASAHLAPCDAWSGQRWSLVTLGPNDADAGRPGAGIALVNGAAGQCLGFDGADSNLITPLQVTHCTLANPQVWHIDDIFRAAL